MSSYFNISSYARAKKNKDELEKCNPQNPVLKDEDEKFLEKVTSSDNAVVPAEKVETTKIADDGEEKPASTEEQTTGGQVVVPETQPDEQKPELPPRPGTSSKKAKKDKEFELPTQEEAEAATRGWNDQVKVEDRPGSSGSKRTWVSYLPNTIRPTSAPIDSENAQKTDAEQKETSVDASSPKQTWAMYASQYVPSSETFQQSIPSLPASWNFKSKDKDAKAEPVYNEDGSIDEEKTLEKQEKEVSVLLDNLNLSSINNRVFAFSGETQKVYERFAQVLKDTINGGPTAYEDMEKLMKDAGPQLEKQFDSMPPFVQTLVKSLPAKLGTTLVPEVMAVASERPGADMKIRMESASKGEKYTDASTASKPADTNAAEKKKRRIPGLKGLMSSQGAVAGMLRSTVSFISTRFPFLASTTNVVMSLSVFILMFVFWYCHKRGREVRLAKSAEAEQIAGDGKVEELEDGDEEIEEDDTDEQDEDYDEDAAEKLAVDMDAKLNQPAPADVPLPKDGQEEKTSLKMKL